MLELLLAQDGLLLGDEGVGGIAAAIAATMRMDAARPVRVAIASAVRLVREGLSGALCRRAGIAELHTFALDAEGMIGVARMAPDVVLVDLSGTTPEAAAQTLRAACPEARLVAFALAEIDHDVFACAESGFAGYVAKNGGADELHRAVLDATQGRMHCAPHITAAMFGRLGALLRLVPHRSPLAQLTERESEVLARVDEGRSNKEIARLLKISNATVKNHMHNILQKLQVARRSQAAARLRHGDPGV
jgi:two-component system nitrate/nitrite response regulator NarL